MLVFVCNTTGWDETSTGVPRAVPWTVESTEVITGATVVGTRLHAPMASIKAKSEPVMIDEKALRGMI
ncbi:MAG TPA: hypothetical protein VF831_09475 [Anaerolineales bacterium]